MSMQKIPFCSTLVPNTTEITKYYVGTLMSVRNEVKRARERRGVSRLGSRAVGHVLALRYDHKVRALLRRNGISTPGELDW